ncbi:hypothetical protein RND71_020407 [Anisodus tanguticus]|uniref:Transposase MuDR plant domain-containing protein n=1 Tax=Anisodus tanguticus TaxID=243964 RepID=A0AAE1S141_9SOLA|nr:hypothetical protein RND71_020407 [Anisodus tanguticus]
MDGICIVVAYNGKWTTDNKYLDHETKLILVNDEITFEGLVEKIFQVLKLKRGEIEANIWFDTKLETSKGMLVTNDDEVSTCIYLRKNDSNFKASRFIVDIAERNSLSANSSKTELCDNIVHEEGVNSEPQEEGLWEMHIGHKALIEVEPTMEVEYLKTKEITEDRGHTSNGKKVRRRSASTSKRSNLPTVVLREDASLDEIVVGSLFADKQCLKKCFSSNAIKYHFRFKVDKSCKLRYYLKCYDDECSWYLHSSQVHDSALFKITSFEKNHSCSIDETDQRHATYKVISDYIIELLHDTDAEIKPKFVVEEMRRRYGLSISYHKAWRAIQLALGPEMDDQFQTE